MIRGTNHDQDARFANKTQKMLTKSLWPQKYDIKVDLKKVDYQLIKVWIQRKITKLLGEEDDIVSGTIISHLDQNLQKELKLDAKKLHIAISGVLPEKTLIFMSQFWDILDEAQRSSRGIPECLIQEKKNSEDMHRRKLNQLQDKRYKMNVNRFNHTIRDDDHRRSRHEEYRSQRDHKKKHRDRDRSRSRSRHKKHRSRSNQKRRKDKLRQKQSRKNKHRKPQEQDSQSPYRRSHRRRQHSSQRASDSSGVVSSSQESN